MLFCVMFRLNTCPEQLFAVSVKLNSHSLHGKLYHTEKHKANEIEIGTL